MRFAFDVTFNDDRTIRVEVGPRSLVEFERKFGVPASDLSDSTRLEWVLFLAWDACVRAKRWTGEDFEAFVDEIAAVVAVEETPAGPLSGTRADQEV